MSRDIFFRLILSFIIIVLIFALHRIITISARPDRPVLASERPLLFAHRGGALLAPENTLAAFRNGAGLGADALELDVRLTADAELVVFHDETLERTTDGSGVVRDHTLEELRRLDAGYRFTTDGGQTFPYRDKGVGISTLAEIYADFPDHIINVDIKDPDPLAAERLVEVITQSDATERTIVASFHDRILRDFRRLAPDVATAAGANETRTFFLFNLAHLWRFHRPLGDVYQIPTTYGNFKLAAPRFIESANLLNQAVQFWTIDDPAEMRRLLEMGANGIMTDRPDLAAEVFREFGCK
jgi:glycerophosphoryl diester phosphodiesterase